jgi:hypothetical protein
VKRKWHQWRNEISSESMASAASRNGGSNGMK